MTTPRIIKSHLPYRYFKQQLKGKKTKVILAARNIKDTLVSLYHLYRMDSGLGNMTGPFEEFFELFKAKHLFYGDYFDHILSYWNNKLKFNLFVMKYEDLHKDLKGSVRRLVAYLGEELSEDQLTAIVEHVGFQAMQTNDSTNKSWIPELNQAISPFVRKGIVGDWMNYFNEEQMEYVDALYKEKMDGTFLMFDDK